MAASVFLFSKQNIDDLTMTIVNGISDQKTVLGY
jgi:hypothetical protein